LYFLLAARPPFPGGTLTQKLARHQEEVPTPVETLRTDLPPGMVAVLRRMLAKRPADRYQTPAAVAEALAPFTQESSAAVGGGSPSPSRVRSGSAGSGWTLRPDATVATPASLPKSGKRRPWIMAAAAGGVVLLGAVLFFLLRPSGPHGRPPSQAPPPPLA